MSVPNTRLKAVATSLVVFVIALCVASVTESAAQYKYKGWQSGPWEKYSTKKGMTMWLNEEVPTGVDGVRVDAVIDMPADEIFPILIDEKRASGYSFIREFKILQKDGKRGLLYQRVKATGIQDRDFTVHLEMIEPKTKNGGSYGWVWVQANDKGPPPKDGVVRAETVAGSYMLTPIGENKDKTLVSYRLWFDPSSWVPDFLINAAVRDAAWETVDRLRKDAKKYKETGSWK